VQASSRSWTSRVRRSIPTRSATTWPGPDAATAIRSWRCSGSVFRRPATSWNWDLTEEVFASIEAKRAEQGNANVRDPIRIDLTDAATFPSDERRYDAIFVINIFQVAPVAINDGIAALAAKTLKDDGRVYIYGPFKIDGRYTTPSNQAFDEEIRAAAVPEWGLKDVRDLEAAARPHGIVLTETIERPANNFILVFGRAGSPATNHSTS